MEYIEGENGESVIPKIGLDKHFRIGKQAGIDLKKITSIKSKDNTWLERKWRKHQRFLYEYSKSGYKFTDDDKIIEFINVNYKDIKHENDCLQHDDFHLGNIIINKETYAGVIDFNRYDWGDPLHEFVKMEMFSYEFSKEFVKGQINGYFGTNKLNENIIKTIMVYIAMAIISTIVWTLKFYPNTMPYIEKINNRIIHEYKSFDLMRPVWAL